MFIFYSNPLKFSKCRKRFEIIHRILRLWMIGELSGGINGLIWHHPLSWVHDGRKTMLLSLCTRTSLDKVGKPALKGFFTDKLFST